MPLVPLLLLLLSKLLLNCWQSTVAELRQRRWQWLRADWQGAVWLQAVL
jgi:hypothetical protein